MSEAILKIMEACGAAGYTPVGATQRAAIEDGCAYIRANSAPDGEGKLWAEAQEATTVVEAFFAGR